MIYVIVNFYIPGLSGMLIVITKKRDKYRFYISYMLCSSHISTAGAYILESHCSLLEQDEDLVGSWSEGLWYMLTPSIPLVWDNLNHMFIKKYRHFRYIPVITWKLEDWFQMLLQLCISICGSFCAEE
jgi:hypothetical protein